MRLRYYTVLSFTIVLALTSSLLEAQRPPCLPCVGLHTQDPAGVAELLKASPLELQKEARLYVSFDVSLNEPLPEETLTSLRQVGASPWLHFTFQTPAPLLENLESFEKELEAVSRLASKVGPKTHFTISWNPIGKIQGKEFAFLFKRASVTVTGAATEAVVLAQGLPLEALEAFYGEDTSAYLDGMTVLPGSRQQETADKILALDAGRTVVTAPTPWPQQGNQIVVIAAQNAAQGIPLSFFELDQPNAESLTPFIIVANEFAGDLAFDSYSVPNGAPAWSFVRGEDLSLRVVVDSTDPVALLFSDTMLRNPQRLKLNSGETEDIFDLQRAPEGLTVRLTESGPHLLRLDRPSVEEMEGVEDRISVAGERQLPVEEILRRLQAFEDGQNRKIRHYTAHSALHLRFQGGNANSMEVSFQGPFFFHQKEGFDWAWETLYLNGVKWRGKTLPEIPLLQPEKAAARPLEISFTRDYRYRLKGTGSVNGRDCWIVEFEPGQADQAEEEFLFQGTVWVDRELFARVKTRALQLGLSGEVISNEETVFFEPLTLAGTEAPWQKESYFLPTRVVGQQIYSVLNTAVPVVKETLLENIQINGEGFVDQRKAIRDSEVTMVRDTPQGLRYLVTEEDTGERVVKEGFDRDKLFVVGGVFYDESLDFPLPLVGINYFSLDYKESGKQTNLFFGGVLLVGNLAEPSLFGSQWDVGLDVFGLGISFSDTFYLEDQEVPELEVETRPARLTLNLGRPFGNFFKLGFRYGLAYDSFGRADDTSDDFVIPQSHLSHTLGIQGRYSRGGYSITLDGAFTTRDGWEAWGLPEDIAAFDAETEDYVQWTVKASKSWYFSGFKKLSLSLDYADGEDLDRFSKFGFGFFGDTQVHGFRNDKIRADTFYGTHLRGGFELGEVIRLEGVLDAVWATDEASGLDNELLAGLGLVGTFPGPWNTLMQFDVGAPIEGPEDGFVAYIVFLKLFK